jgi:YD repeat-containing protein
MSPLGWKPYRIVLLALFLILTGRSAAAAPNISSLSPTSGAVGASVTITGTNFGSPQGTSTVKFNGTTATVTSWSATSIVAKVPTGATTGNVVVTVSNVASNGVSFTVVGAPSITSLTPTTGAVGASVTIAGSNFGSTQGSSTVKFNGTAATAGTWSATSITVTVPSGGTTGNVVVHASGVDSNGKSFTVVAAPSITSLTPTSGAVGASVTVAGSNFGTTQGTSTVKFNGTTATVGTWGATSISVTVPSGATTGNVVVHASGVDSNGSSFTVVGPPTISSLSPTTGAVGASVTITGTNFGATQGSSTVKFNTTTATPATWSATSIVVPVPSGATTGNVVVHASGVNTNGVNFTVVSAPHISSISPTSGAAGASVTINGTNFGSTQGSASVLFNGTVAAISSWTSTKVISSVPSGATTGNVVVNASGVNSNGVSFTVIPSPVITGIAPNPGPIGVTVSVSGSNFGASQGSSTLTFNGTAATPTSWSPTSIVTTVPAGATTGNVIITVAGGPSNGFPFTVYPFISSVTPVAAAAGATITISGLNFGPTQGGSTVSLNGSLVPITSWNSTTIVAQVPNRATTGNLVVTVAGLTSNIFSFTVPPVLAAASTYYLFEDGSNSPEGGWLLGTFFFSNPLGILSNTVDVTGKPIGEYQITAFATNTGVPNATGTIPSGSTVSFSLFMSKSGTTGTFFPRAKLYLDSPSGTLLCTATGTTALPANFIDARMNFSCQTTSDVTIGPNDTFDLWVGVNYTALSTDSFPGAAVTWGANPEMSAISTPAIVGPPSLASVSPSDGAVGAPVTITGASLGATQGNSTISFNGTLATATSWSASSVATSVPAGATSGPLYLNVNGIETNSLGFTVDPAPTINTLVPNAAAIGAFVTINGAHFGTAQGTVTFNGISASVILWANASIQVIVPTGATTGAVVVTVPGGEVANGPTFTVLPAPTITSISPTVGPPGTSVTFTGTSFGTTQGTGSVNMGGAVATPTSWSDTQVVAPVPATALTGNFFVFASGVYSNAATFTVTPTITSIAPYFANVGSSVSINGLNFETFAGTVTFNGIQNVPSTTNWGSSSITLLVPTGATTGPVVLTTIDGLVSNAFPFTVGSAPTPVISSVSPSSGIPGATVTISGSNFGSSQGSSTLKFNGVAAAPSSWGMTSIVAQVPSGATTGNIVVAVSGLASNGFSFTVPIPVLTNLLPSSGGVGTSVTIAGQYFGSSQSAVNGSVAFNGTSATPSSWGPTSIIVPVPTGATSGNVVVNASGAASNGLSFTVVPSPTITSLSQTSGSVGASIAVTGTNFGTSQGTSTVTFNGTAATPTTWSTTSIATTVPAGATTGNVVVTVSGAPSNGSSFTVVGGTLSGTVTKQSDGSAVVGATVQALQNGNVQATATTGSIGSYSIGSLTPGTYDVKFSATGLGTSVLTGITVSSGITTQNASLSLPGTIAGQVTRSGGSTAITGASISISQNSDSVTTAATDNTGNYSISALGPGSYTVQATAVGFVAQSQGGVSVTSNSTTTQNFGLVASSTAPVNYIYDELGRLVGAVDPAGNAASYAYDPVGNILSITRYSSTQVSVIKFTPKSGPVGATVTIYGSGFSSTASQDTVKFNGTTATVTYASSTQLVVTVPTGATTGTISVTSPTGTGTSTASFTVGASPGAPTISGFSPSIGIAGATITISGTNYDATYSNNRVRYSISKEASVTAGTTTSLTSAVPPGATSGHVTVFNPGGSTTSSADFFVPPSPHVATDVAFSGRIALGQSQPITIVNPGQIGLLLFDGTAGQEISVNITNVTGNGTVYLYNPDGTFLAQSASFANSGDFFVVPVISQTGTYQFLLTNSGAGSESATINLYNVPPNSSGTVTINGSGVTLTTTTPGQNAQATFSGSFGQSVTVHVTNSTLSGNGSVKLISTDGVTVLTSGYLYSSPNFNLGSVTLPATGTYTIFVNTIGSGPITGSITLSVTNP